MSRASSTGWRSASPAEGSGDGASRLVEQRRAHLRCLQLEAQLVEQEARRVRGATATPVSRATSTPSLHQYTPTREVAETRSSLRAPSPTGSLVSPHESRCSTPLPPVSYALSPRTSVHRRSSRNSRHSNSSGERNTGRLARAVVLQLVERASQESQRQLEALRLHTLAQQRHMQMRAEAVRVQSEMVRAAIADLKRLEQRRPLTLEAIDRWEAVRWIDRTDREARRLRLQLGAARLQERRAAHKTSEADLQLLKAHTLRRQEELMQLQSTLKRSGPLLGERKQLALAQHENAIASVRRELAMWRGRTEERRGLLLALRKRNQHAARQALALEHGADDVNLQMVTEYACLRGREDALRQELQVWERRQVLLRQQLLNRKRGRKTTKVPPERAPAPHSSPVGSVSRGEGSLPPIEASASEVFSPRSGSPNSATSRSTSSSRYLPNDC